MQVALTQDLITSANTYNLILSQGHRNQDPSHCSETHSCRLTRALRIAQNRMLHRCLGIRQHATAHRIKDSRACSCLGRFVGVHIETQPTQHAVCIRCQPHPAETCISQSFRPRWTMNRGSPRAGLYLLPMFHTASIKTHQHPMRAATTSRNSVLWGLEAGCRLLLSPDRSKHAPSHPESGRDSPPHNARSASSFSRGGCSAVKV